METYYHSIKDWHRFADEEAGFHSIVGLLNLSEGYPEIY